MITGEELKEARQRSLKYFEKAGIAFIPEEREQIEVVDCGLGDLAHTGVEILTYVNTLRCCAKELVLFPGQTCPEHKHPHLIPVRRKRSVAGGVRSICMFPVHRLPDPRPSPLPGQNNIIRSGMKLSSTPGTSILCRLITCTGFRRVEKGRWFPSFLP